MNSDEAKCRRCGNSNARNLTTDSKDEEMIFDLICDSCMRQIITQSKETSIENQMSRPPSEESPLPIDAQYTAIKKYNSKCKAVFEMCATCCKGPNSEDAKAMSKLFICNDCHSAYFCSRECQQRAWELHKAPCKALKQKGLIACVSMNSTTDCLQVFLDPLDPVFVKSLPSPMMVTCGIPLQMTAIEPGTENHWCSYLMADPTTGVIPDPWKKLGTVVISRTDRMPITVHHMYLLVDFSFSIGKTVNDSDHAAVRASMLSAMGFQRFLTAHVGRLPEYQGISW